MCPTRSEGTSGRWRPAAHLCAGGPKRPAEGGRVGVVGEELPPDRRESVLSQRRGKFLYSGGAPAVTEGNAGDVY